jgi:hypothetical protein
MNKFHVKGNRVLRTVSRGCGSGCPGVSVKRVNSSKLLGGALAIAILMTIPKELPVEAVGLGESHGSSNSLYLTLPGQWRCWCTPWRSDPPVFFPFPFMEQPNGFLVATCLVEMLEQRTTLRRSLGVAAPNSPSFTDGKHLFLLSIFWSHSTGSSEAFAMRWVWSLVMDFGWLQGVSRAASGLCQGSQGCTCQCCRKHYQGKCRR